jgi:non-specific serine/threonine protein kinase
LGYYEVSRGNYARAEPYFTEALSLARDKGESFALDIILSGLAECALRQGDYDLAAVFEEESLLMRKASGEKWGIAVSLANFAWIAINQNDLEKAGTMLMESLTLRHEIQEPGGMAWCLEKLAKINILVGQRKSGPPRTEYYRRAVQLFGAAEALRKPVGSVIDAADQAQYNLDLETLRKTLGSEVFSRLWFEAENMPLEEVIAMARTGLAEEPTGHENEKLGGLTAREREVVVLISQGRSNREIAAAMTVGQKTVETYVTRILNKLGFDSRVQIATWAIGNRIAPPGKS